MSTGCISHDQLRGYDDLTFDFALADAVVTRAHSSIDALGSQQKPRATNVDHALEDFHGWFSEVFSDNASQARTNCEQLIGRLKDVVVFMGELIEAAHQENARRQQARQWKAEVESRQENVLLRARDWLLGEPEVPIPPQSPPPRFDPVDVTVAPREPVSAPGPSGDTSSARPQHLRTFAERSHSLDTSLESHPSDLARAVEDFMATCDYGGIGGAVGGGVAAATTRVALRTTPTVLPSQASNATRLAHRLTGNRAARSALSRGADSAASNMSDYRLNAEDRTWLGCLGNGLTGFVTGILGSRTSTGLQSRISRPLGKHGVDYLIGAGTGVVNEAIRPMDDKNPLETSLRQMAMGAVGMRIGLHRAGS